MKSWILLPALWLVIGPGPLAGDGGPQACGLCETAQNKKGSRERNQDLATVTLVVNGMMKSRSGAT
jgi:hypothetical protein